MTGSRNGDCPRCADMSFAVDITSDQSVRDGIEKIARLVLPSWDVSKVSIKVLIGGTTNKLFLCEYTPSGQKFLCRIYGEGTDRFIDRNGEVQNMHFLYDHGMGPRVLCTFRNGLCYDFFEGKTLDLEMIVDEENSRLIADHMARMHAIPLSATHGKEAKISSMLENYLSLVPSERILSAEKSLGSEFHKPIDIAQEVLSMKKVFETIECAIVFCHNDLSPNSIVLAESRVHFIDFEYASSNYQAFDIGNFFTEFGGQESYDRSLYPTKDRQFRWIRAYLSEFARTKGDNPPTEDDINKLYVEVNKLALSSLLMWGIWALIQAANSTIDTDFENLALSRLGMYFCKKDEFLAL